MVMWECDSYRQATAPEPKNESLSTHHCVRLRSLSRQEKGPLPHNLPHLQGRAHPISVSLGDTLNSSTHLCNADPKQLVTDFVDKLRRPGDLIREVVRQLHLPDDLEFSPTKQKNRIQEWCDQVPVLGFNSGKYNLNLIKEHFVNKITNTAKNIKVAKKANQTMFLLTPHFRFLDVMNYLGPGTSYNKWVKAYGCKLQKSWFPYEWFNNPDKLQHPGLPDYPAWYPS